MHHFPLFRRALGLYYSDKDSLDPPELKDMTGGLLDRSVEDHQSRHMIPLVGLDHGQFSQWNYPDDIEEDGRGHRGGEQTASDHGDASSPLCETKGQSEPMNIVEDFNNLAGALTDGPLAFPYTFTMQMKNELKFDDLVKYCQSRTCEAVGPLPSRDKWGCVNPVLLMEDPVDPTTGRTSHRYTVTSRGHLSTVAASQNGVAHYYNEVFLPGRPVSRLNLDVDLRCCQKCNARFSTHAQRCTKHKVSQALATSLILVIVESLFGLTKVTKAELESDPSLSELAKAVGKIAVYVRASSTKSKLSLRMLWYLPVELCSSGGIESYKTLLDKMETVSLNYVLLSYPADVEACGLCGLSYAMRTGGRDPSGSKYLRLSPVQVANRRSSIDKAPYSFRKCVRLPNCYKEDSGFDYVDTFNIQDIEDPGFDDPLSLSVGLSSNPILSDVTSLGSRFRDVLKEEPGRSRPRVVSKLEQVPNRARVESEARRLAILWGVPVAIRRSGSGLFCIQANDKSTTYPCPIHNRVHSTSKLGALVFAQQTKPKCFVP